MAAKRHTRTRTPHTDKKNIDGNGTIAITHPFHPDKDKEYEYLGLVNGRARCVDENGRTRLFPINHTSLQISVIGKGLADGSFIASVEELLALKGLVDQLQGDRQVLS
jgi:hypothetical protein